MVTATYTYNGDGTRMSKTVSGSTTAFTWDDTGSLLSEGTISYIYGADGLPLEQVTSAGVVTYYHHDDAGSTRALTSSTGTVVGSYTYDANGTTVASTGSAANPFRYVG